MIRNSFQVFSIMDGCMDASRSQGRRNQNIIQALTEHFQTRIAPLLFVEGGGRECGAFI